MTRELAVVITIGIAVVALAAMALAWRRRTRRDAHLVAPLGVPEHAEVLSRHGMLYVATTQHEQPLERLAVKSLAFRARGELTVTDRGVALSLDGEPTVFLPSARMVSAGRATVAIDRVVEPGGLIRITWNITDAQPVDSYLRLTEGDPQTLIADLQRLCAAPETGANP